MSDKPILFSAPMVKALLAGTKTQTRRIVKPQPVPAKDAHLASYAPIFTSDWVWSMGPGSHIISNKPHGPDGWADKWVRFKLGDRLYVRETFAPLIPGGDNAPKIDDATYSMTKDGAHVYRDGLAYFPGLASYAPGAFDRIKWRPGIHMPRWASRLTLHVNEVRVQQLQDISEKDALAEGVAYDRTAECFTVVDMETLAGYGGETARECYAALWGGINGADSWSANPWVVAITFTVEKCNIASASTAA